MTKEEDLRERTYKGGTFDLTKRVSHTLTDERKTTKAVALLVNHLHGKGLISIDEIDDLLLEAAGQRDY